MSCLINILRFLHVITTFSVLVIFGEEEAFLAKVGGAAFFFGFSLHYCYKSRVVKWRLQTKNFIPVLFLINYQIYLQNEKNLQWTKKSNFTNNWVPVDFEESQDMDVELNNEIEFFTRVNVNSNTCQIKVFFMGWFVPKRGNHVFHKFRID